MPTYEHKCQACNYEFEEEYSIKADPPKICPQCKAESVIRLISLGGKGVVELSGQDLVDKVKSDAKNIQKEASKDANKYASLIGESRYHELQTKLDRRRSY
jgi:putative FmdB family regulatory protein